MVTTGAWTYRCDLIAADCTVCVSFVTCSVTSVGSGDEGRLVGLVQAEEGGVVGLFIHMNIMMMMMMIIIIIMLCKRKRKRS